MRACILVCAKNFPHQELRFLFTRFTSFTLHNLHMLCTPQLICRRVCMCSEENKYGLPRGSATYRKHHSIKYCGALSITQLGVNSVFFSEEYRTCYADIQNSQVQSTYTPKMRNCKSCKQELQFDKYRSLFLQISCNLIVLIHSLRDIIHILNKHLRTVCR